MTQRLVTSDGGHAESFSYLLYSMESYVPFLVAMRRLTGGETWHYRNFFAYRDVEGEEIEELPDLTGHPTLKAVHESLLRLQFPNRHTPNFDDSHSLPIPRVYLASALNEPRFLHHLLEPEPHLENSSHGVDISADTFALWNPDMDPEPLDYAPDQCLIEAGACALRTGWESDDTYALLMGENGPMRTEGGQHEHPEQFHITVFGAGHPLLLDGGYVRWSDKHLVDTPENHNLILVDGAGPPDEEYFVSGTDTFLSDFWTDQGISSAASSCEYAETSFMRTVVLLSDTLFVVADEFTTDQSRTFEWQWHGNGGGETGFDYAMEETRAIYTLDTTRMWVESVSSEGIPGYSHTLGSHSFDHAQVIQHETTQVTINAQSGTLLTAFALTPTDTEQSPFTVQESQDMLSISDYEGTWYIRVLGPEDSPSEMETPCGSSLQSRTLLIAHCDSDGSSPPFVVNTGSSLELTLSEAWAHP